MLEVRERDDQGIEDERRLHGLKMHYDVVLPFKEDL
jgi:hypothetical protein